MPPPASRHLALLVMAADPDAEPAPIATLYAAWAGLITGRRLVPGGHGVVRLHVEAAPRFLANRQGGFRACCPVTGENVVGAFVPALTAWRAGGPRRLDCACGEPHDLATLAFAPEAGFARAWVEITAAEAGELAPEALEVAKELLGQVRIVLRRG